MLSCLLLSWAASRSPPSTLVSRNSHHHQMTLIHRQSRFSCARRVRSNRFERFQTLAPCVRYPADLQCCSWVLCACVGGPCWRETSHTYAGLQHLCRAWQQTHLPFLHKKRSLSADCADSRSLHPDTVFRLGELGLNSSAGLAKSNYLEVTEW